MQSSRFRLKLPGTNLSGLSRDDLERIARDGSKVRKVSRRDLPLAVAKQLDGATTVSATMYLLGIL